MVWKKNLELDRLDEPFEIHDGVIIQEGKYWFTRHEIQFNTFRGRRISIGSELSWGGYYSGSRESAELSVMLNVNKHLNLSADYQWNKLKFSQADFITRELGGRIAYAFSPKLNTSLFGQWNNEDDEILLNVRLHWIPKIGNELYLAFNQEIFTGSPKWIFKDTTILLKFVWRFSY